MTLHTEHLACIRGHKTLFSELNMTLNPGQVLIVEGSNGSGKTSLLKTLTGLRPPNEGDVLWCGESIASLGSEYREKLAWLGHHNGIKEDLTALENLRLARALDAAGEKSINEVLDEVGLRGRKHSFPRQFSAGMKRRLALARLLLLDATLWILDEPQSALDKKGIAQFEWFLAKHLQNGGMAVMTSHHDVNLPGCKVDYLKLGAE